VLKSLLDVLIVYQQSKKYNLNCDDIKFKLFSLTGGDNKVF
jgi:hypothetical protein